MGPGEFATIVLVGAVVLLVAVAAAGLSTRIGLPSLLLYLGLGVVLGEDVIGVRFDDLQVTQLAGYAALVVILAEGGLTTTWRRVRPAVPFAAVLSTVGTAVSVLVVAGAAYALLGMSWRHALLTGAVVSATDAAAVFSVLRRVPLHPRLSGLLEAESGFNDAPVVILVVALASAHPASPPVLLAEIALELAVGTVVGIAVGRGGAWALRRIGLPAGGLYPVAVLSLVVAAYGLAATLHGSGFLATYLAAVVLGNSGLPHRPTTRSFVEGLAWLAQIGLFVLLGLLADPSRLPREIGPAVVVGAVLLLVARPVSVLVSNLPFSLRRKGLTAREQVFVSWAGLRGAVPIVMTTVPRDRLLFDLTFVLVVVFTLVQAPTLPWFARRTAVVDPSAARELDIESSPLSTLDVDVLEVDVTPGSLLHGVELFELRLPQGAAVTLLVRGGSATVPTMTTPLRTGDRLLVVVTAAAREQTERRLRAVSRSGRLAGWRGDRGVPR